MAGQGPRLEPALGLRSGGPGRGLRSGGPGRDLRSGEPGRDLRSGGGARGGVLGRGAAACPGYQLGLEDEAAMLVLVGPVGLVEQELGGRPAELVLGLAHRGERLAAAQQAGDVLGASAVLMDAYNTDVRPLLAELRGERGLDPDPVAAYHGSGYAEKIVAQRVGGQQAGWGA